MISVTVDGKQFVVNPKDMEFITAGGQGPVYKWRSYTLKFHEDDSILRKMNEIRRRLPASKSEIPDSLSHRTFMIGSGTADCTDVGISEGGTQYVLVFNWLDGSLLDYKSKNTLKSRSGMASDVVEGLLFLEKIGVVHADLNPANYLVDPRGIAHLIDIEGAGVLQIGTQTWATLLRCWARLCRASRRLPRNRGTTKSSRPILTVGLA